jgi:uncharacterized protein
MPDVQLLADPRRECLIGSRCRRCETYYFPPEHRQCRNPHCGQAELDEVALSRTGAIWSYTNACVSPPEPYVRRNPFVPFAIAAVLLEQERLLVLGPVVADVAVERLRIGMQMELVIEASAAEDAADEILWKWRPV